MTALAARRLVVENIGWLCTLADGGADALGTVRDAAVLVEDGRVRYAGPAADLPAGAGRGADVLDARGRCVLPGFVDCHTHLLFAGSRADEFALRSRGATYAEIMAAGGGIRRTMHAVRAASVDELVELCLPRLDGMLDRGVTTVEVKSGYGLSLDAEVKSLRAIRALGEQHPTTVRATCLSAHAVPPEFADRTDAYVDLIVEEILPRVAEEGLATAADVFVEQGAFSVDQGRRVLSRAKELGLAVRVHAEQLSRSGGAALAAELSAQSAGHLEFATAEDLAGLARAGVVVEVLATAQVFLGMKERVPGRAARDAGCTVAVATDYNPGSANAPDLHLAAGLAVTMAGLSAEEALVGITAGGARALGLDDAGVLREGARGDLVFLDEAEPWPLVYEWGVNHVERVVIAGELVRDRAR